MFGWLTFPRMSDSPDLASELALLINREQGASHLPGVSITNGLPGKMDILSA